MSFTHQVIAAIAVILCVFNGMAMSSQCECRYGVTSGSIAQLIIDMQALYNVNYFIVQVALNSSVSWLQLQQQLTLRQKMNLCLI